MQPFRLEIPSESLADLHARLDRTRWPDELPGADWAMGIPVARVRELAGRLRALDWRAVEERVNAVPQFTAEVDGQPLHFVHVRSPRADALPLVITHGWPSSYLEHLPLLGALTEPPEGEPAFHVVLPSVPGFPGSGPTRERGWSTQRVAAAFVELMGRLGYERFGAHGGDVGSGVSRAIGVAAPERVVGVHVLEVFAFPSGDESEMAQLDEDDWARLAVAQRFASEHAGYQEMQTRRPQTLAFGLSDSPAGQLAWLADFWEAFGDKPVSHEALLVETAALYWLTNASAGAARIYFEDVHPRPAPGELKVPLGVAVFPENFRSVRKLAERDNPRVIRHWSDMESGGHFAAMDEPEALVADLRAFFGGVG